jgi:hypothetical protein
MYFNPRAIEQLHIHSYSHRVSTKLIILTSPLVSLDRNILPSVIRKRNRTRRRGGKGRDRRSVFARSCRASCIATAYMALVMIRTIGMHAGPVGANVSLGENALQWG